jgi:CRP/FNR family cyclic AMP-dependent transcriptional regulator
MGGIELRFEIFENYDCPLYNMGDKFVLSGNALLLPPEKPACLELVGDITEFINISTSITISGTDCNSGDVSFNCSGCTGLVRLSYEKVGKKTAGIPTQDKAAGNIANLLRKFSMFKTLRAHEIKELVSLLKIKSFSAGEFIVKKGDPGENLFIITSGKVEVLDDDQISIALLERGDVFGEMSLLSGDPVVASVKVVEDSKVLSIDSRNFRKVLTQYPSLQMYLARLLTKRLAKANLQRSVDLSAEMSGSLSETPTSELFQTCNINEKTGVLTLNLSGGTAELWFNGGKLIRVRYSEKEDKEAFYELLKENRGRYKFVSGLSEDAENIKEIGHFMCLLMEGLSKMDEEGFEKK